MKYEKTPFLKKLAEENPEFAAIFNPSVEEKESSFFCIFQDLRNMLTVINSACQFTEHEHPETLSFKYWNAIKENTQSMCALLDQIDATASQYNLQ